MFDDDVDIALFSYGLQRVEDIAVVSAQILFDKTAGGQAQGREIADVQQPVGQVQR